MTETWKEVQGTDGRYEVSNTGFLRTKNWKNSGQTKIMKPALDAKGYLRTMIVVNGRAKTIKIHRLVAEAWIPNPDNKPQVNHINCNKQDNSVANLEWATKEENVAHAVMHGRFKFPRVAPPHKVGSQIGTSKLTEDQVREIRAKFKPRIYTREMLAKEYGVAAATIKDVILRRWKHVV